MFTSLTAVSTNQLSSLVTSMTTELYIWKAHFSQLGYQKNVTRECGKRSGKSFPDPLAEF